MEKLAAGLGVIGQHIGSVGWDNYSTLPHVLLRCLDMSQAPRVDVEQLSTIIRLDPALVARFFSLADFTRIDIQNSNDLLVDVLEQLGIENVNAVIKSATLSQVFHADESEYMQFLKQYWQHSLFAALSAQLIAEKTKYKPDEAYLSTLLHDLGKVSLVNQFGKQYLSFISEHEMIDNAALEAREFGKSHTLQASTLIREWGWSSFVADAVEFHHEPLESVSNAHELVKICFFANCLAHKNDSDSINVGQKLFGFGEKDIASIQILAEEKLMTIAERIDLGLENDSGEQAVSTTILDKDLKKQNLLVAKIYDNIMVDQVTGSFDDTSEIALINSVLKGSNILFGFTEGLFFKFDEGPGSLHCKFSGAHSSLEGLEVGLKSGSSLIADALIRNEITNSFASADFTGNESTETSGDTSLLDLQIARYFDQQGILCLPLVDIQKHEPVKVGVMVFAMDESLFHLIQLQQNLVYAYLQQSASCLNEFYLHKSEAQNEISSELITYKTKIRGMVHEAKNPLTIIQHYLELLKQRLPKEVCLDSEINLLKEEVHRVSKILSSHRELATPVEQTDGCDINQTLVNLVNFFNESLLKPESIDIELNLDSSLPLIDIETDKFKQIVSNLLKNAAEELISTKSLDQEMGQLSSSYISGEKIKITTRNRIIVNGCHFFEINIQDNGRGISDEVMDNLFRPVSSSKGHGHQGLGLSIVKNLVEEMNGFISCKTGSGEGTSFQILLPRKVVPGKVTH